MMCNYLYQNINESVRIVILKNLMENTQDFSGVKKQCTKWKTFGLVQCAIRMALQYDTWEAAVGACPNILGEEAMSRQYNLMVKRGEETHLKKKMLKENLPETSTFGVKKDWVRRVLGDKIAQLVQMAHIERNAEKTSDEQMRNAEDGFDTDGKIIIENLQGEEEVFHLSCKVFQADYENGTGINQIPTDRYRVIHLSVKFGLNMFDGDNVATSYHSMLTAFSIFRDMIAKHTPWTLVFVHVMPHMIGDTMKALIDSGLANMKNKQATRLLIWQKMSTASARGPAQLPHDCDYVVMGIHSKTTKLPANLYKCWHDRSSPGYPHTTVVDVPRIGSNTLDGFGKVVNRTESNPFGAYMVNHPPHTYC